MNSPLRMGVTRAMGSNGGKEKRAEVGVAGIKGAPLTLGMTAAAEGRKDPESYDWECMLPGAVGRAESSSQKLTNQGEKA